MEEQLRLRSARPVIVRNSLDYRKAGLIKYGLSSIAAVAALLLSGMIGLIAIPLAVLAFYLMEVQFLFLFPLLAEGDTNPYRSSIRICQRMGVLHCVINVLPIAMRMLTGLLNLKDPFRGWHVGCLAVLIWYLGNHSNSGYEA